MFASLLSLGLEMIGRINDYLLSANGTGPSADSKRQLEPPEVLRRLLKHGPTLSM